MKNDSTGKHSIDYYTSQSETSDPRRFTHLYKILPSAIEELCKVVQGLIAHRDGAEEFYGFEVPEDRKSEADLRYVEKIIGRVIELDNSPLDIKRPPEKRVFGTCRDFAILLCSMLRCQKIPARLRCGFSAYFEKGVYIDHWVCEYWSQNKKRWVLVDAELGDEVLRVYKVNFNPVDVPRGKFLVAGKAWQMFRMEKVNPDLFGVPWLDIKGAWFIRANLLRDLVALNKVELLPWDYTDFADKQFEDISEISPKEVEFLDEVADATVDVYDNWQHIKDIYENNPRSQVRKKVTSYTHLGPREVEL